MFLQCEELKMFRVVIDGFERERRHMQEQLAELKECLGSAIADIQFLRGENDRV